MHPNRVYFSTEASQQLNMLKQRTGLDANLSCRLGFCLSLEEGSVPSAEEFGGKAEREISWSTLFGQWDLLFIALLKQRLFQDGLDPEGDFEEQLLHHLNRGIFLLSKRVRHLEDIGALLNSAAAPSDTTPDELIA